MHHDDLEQSVDRALRALPAPQAPSTLLPRIMLAVQQLAARPWYRRAWLTWPLAWQTASVVLVMALAVTARFAWNEVAPSIDTQVVAPGAEVIGHVGAFAAAASATANAMVTVWRSLAEPVLGYAFFLLVLMASTCATFGAAISRVALGGASRS